MHSVDTKDRELVSLDVRSVDTKYRELVCFRCAY